MPLTATDADGDPLTFSVRATSLAYQLDQQLGLHFAGSYYANIWGMNEKWMQDNAGRWVCILQNGEVRRWMGTAADTLKPAALIATLDSSYYSDPSLLWNASSSLQVIATIAGSQLTIRGNGFVGTFVVEVTVSDGYATQTKKFSVTVS